jgi:hypothetical protein
MQTDRKKQKGQVLDLPKLHSVTLLDSVGAS